MNSKQANSHKTLATLLVALTAAAASAVNAGKVTWAWNCESTDYIASGNADNLTCSDLTSGKIATDKNEKDETDYGLSIHDQTGKALVWFHGYRNTSFTIYRGDKASPLGTINLADITQYDHARRAFRCKANNQDGRGEVA